MEPVVYTGLTKDDANTRAQIYKDTGWTTEVIQETNGTYTLKATPPDGSGGAGAGGGNGG